MPPRKRQKASDVFAEGTPVFGTKGSFEEAFPEIKDVTVRMQETGDGVHWQDWWTISKAHLGEYINCSNPLCYNGGVSIGSILRQMVRERQTESETTQKCQGYEGSPKGRRRYRDCFNFFQIRVAIEYNEVIEQ